MTITKEQIQVLWSGNPTTTLAANAQATSDALLIDAAAGGGSISVYASHSGTAATGDTVNFKILYTNGDPLNVSDGTDVYDTAPNAAVQKALVLSDSDPAQATFEILPHVKGIRIWAEGRQGSGTVTIAAQGTISKA